MFRTFFFQNIDFYVYGSIVQQFLAVSTTYICLSFIDWPAPHSSDPHIDSVTEGSDAVLFQSDDSSFWNEQCYAFAVGFQSGFF
jgi:hypothetical protein